MNYFICRKGNIKRKQRRPFHAPSVMQEHIGENVIHQLFKVRYRHGHPKTPQSVFYLLGI